MKFYQTPKNIVDIINKHLPKNASSLLEPSVGDGALVSSSMVAKIKEKVFIDINIDRLNTVKYLHEKSELIHDNFLDWSNNNKGSKFDLILTNPPFSGRVSEWVGFNGKFVPSEVAFIDCCLDHLSENGTLVGIVPDSIVNSERWMYLRKKMLLKGCIQYVYQLPERAFYGIEGSFYLFVFKNSKKMTSIKLRKLDFINDEILIDKNLIFSNKFRMDYDFYKSKSKYLEYFSRFKVSDDRMISDVVVFKRGKNHSNYNNSDYIHTTSLNNEIKILGGNSKKSYFIAVKRVSRNSHMSFSLMSEDLVSSCTDCLLIGKSVGLDVLEIIFSIRVLLSNVNGGEFLLKGAGAKYISSKALGEVPFLNLALIFNDEYAEYVDSLNAKDYARCSNIERALFQSLTYSSNVENLSLRKLQQEKSNLNKEVLEVARAL